MRFTITDDVKEYPVKLILKEEKDGNIIIMGKCNEISNYILAFNSKLNGITLFPLTNEFIRNSGIEVNEYDRIKIL